MGFPEGFPEGKALPALGKPFPSRGAALPARGKPRPSQRRCFSKCVPAKIKCVIKLTSPNTN